MGMTVTTYSVNVHYCIMNNWSLINLWMFLEKSKRCNAQVAVTIVPQDIDELTNILYPAFRLFRIDELAVFQFQTDVSQPRGTPSRASPAIAA